MTSCWDVLELSDDSDRSEVRRAYARLIKKFRPDESPLEFQEIHDAYQEALNWLRYPETVRERLSGGEGSASDEGSQRSDQDGLTEIPEGWFPPGMTQETFTRINEAIQGLADSEMMVEVDGFRISRGDTPAEGFRVERLYSPGNDEHRDSLDEDYRKALDEAIAAVDEILQKPDRANAKYWDFLAECPYLLDQDFRFHLTGNLLRKIAQYNLSRNGASEAPVGLAAMQTLDRYLNFSGTNREDFYQLSEREWFALRMPDPTAATASRGVSFLGLKGGKLLEDKPRFNDPKYEGDEWPELGKLALFGLGIAIVILCSVDAAINDKDYFLYGSMSAAILAFLAALLRWLK